MGAESSCEVTRNRVRQNRRYQRGPWLESTGTKLCYSVQQFLIFFGERILDIAVYVYLAEDSTTAANKHDYFGTGFNAARKIIVQPGDIAHDLIGAFRHRHTAHASTYRNVSVVGWFTDVVVENEHVAFNQIYAYPVVLSALLFENLHCI